MEAPVEVRIIDLAHEWAQLARYNVSSSEEMIKERAKRFDQAYKAIVKTVLEK